MAQKSLAGSNSGQEAIGWPCSPAIIEIVLVIVIVIVITIVIVIVVTIVTIILIVIVRRAGTTTYDSEEGLRCLYVLLRRMRNRTVHFEDLPTGS